VPNRLTTVASARLERLIRRLYAFTLLLSSIESIANSITQARYLNWMSIAMVATLVFIIAMIQLATWTKRNMDRWIFVLGAFGLAAMLLFPWTVADVDRLPSGYQPWLWWVIGMSVVGMGVAARPVIAMSYLVVVTGTWFWLDTSPWGGSSDPFLELQDATYIFLFGGTVLGLFMLVRDSVLKVDIANTLAMKSAVQQASTDAVERERQRIDALIHDRVLNTLLLASNAKTSSEYSSVVKLSEEAIDSLRKADRDPESKPEIQPLGLFRALRQIAVQLIPDANVEILSGGSVDIPAQVAAALTEALIQSLDNTTRHAKATRVSLTLSSPTQSSVSIQLRDNGVGFRLNRIPNDRIGVQTSILKRVEAVGAKATIESTPGSGTLVRLEWNA
jgi:signal transduction histidine kinase